MNTPISAPQKSPLCPVHLDVLLGFHSHGSKISVYKVLIDYEYDVFISYRHRDPVLGWMKNHFLPQLEQWLPECLPVDHDARIFVDLSIDTGEDWPLALERALKHSRCLLPILTPEYFRSAWCRSEWQSMLERERQLGFRTAENPSVLIYPVRFFDGEHFPPEATRMQLRDLSQWNFSVPTFAQTVAFIDFISEMKALTLDLSKLVVGAPQWQADWPIIKVPEAYVNGLRLPE